MIPTLEVVLSGYAFVARRRAFQNPRVPAVRAALRLAKTLAGDRPEDEPAAVLFSFATYRLAFPRAWDTMALLLATNQAIDIGCTLRPPREDAEAMLTAILYGNVGFEDVRAWVAHHLAPIQ